MALCVQEESIWVPFSNVTTPRYNITAIRKDWAGSEQNCAGYLLVTKSEFDEFKKSTEFDIDIFNSTFLGILLLFVIGLGVGMVINLIRKARP